MTPNTREASAGALRWVWALTVLVAVSAAPVAAQEEEGMAMAGGGGVVAAAQDDWADVSGKLMSLAEAFPADKYSWRPAEGIRSVSEVFMHVVGANYFLTSQLGGEMPEGVGRSLEQRVTSKEEALPVLKASIDHVTEVLAGLDESTLGKTHTFFDQETTGYEVLLHVLSHAHEHLGQAIAYARSTGVVPPWSAGGGEGG